MGLSASSSRGMLPTNLPLYSPARIASVLFLMRSLDSLNGERLI